MKRAIFILFDRLIKENNTELIRPCADNLLTQGLINQSVYESILREYRLCISNYPNPPTENLTSKHQYGASTFTSYENPVSQFKMDGINDFPTIQSLLLYLSYNNPSCSHFTKEKIANASEIITQALLFLERTNRLVFYPNTIQCYWMNCLSTLSYLCWQLCRITELHHNDENMSTNWIVFEYIFHLPKSSLREACKKARNNGKYYHISDIEIMNKALGITDFKDEKRFFLNQTADMTFEKPLHRRKRKK